MFLLLLFVALRCNEQEQTKLTLGAATVHLSFFHPPTVKQAGLL